MSPIRKILLAEDDPAVRDLIELFLENMMFEFETTATRAGALRLLTAKPKFDLVLVNFWLADGNATDVLDYLRDTRPQTPVIVVAGAGGDLDMETIEAIAEVSGGAHFMQKPLVRETLRGRVADLLGNTEKNPS